jgi:hypothetical protein
MIFVRRASNLRHSRRPYSGYSEPTGASSSAANFIADVFFSREIPACSFTEFKKVVPFDNGNWSPTEPPI